MKKLLIVESPAKAKTIAKYLGGEFTVKSSVGHVRDLPTHNLSVRIVPSGDGKWRFLPEYEIRDDKAKVVKELRTAAKASDEIYLASDPDREGEAIAWHLRTVLEDAAGGKPFKRVTYNEITKGAVLKAVAAPRDIDIPMVDAQQARRILDRIVGYMVSPVLWRNVRVSNAKTLSAGRVQSVALRLLVERQREIDSFKPETYYLMGAIAKKRGAGKDGEFKAKLARFDGKKPDIRSRETADNIVLDLSGAALKVANLKEQPKTRHTLPPFTTSTLQQAASSVLGMSPGKTMSTAQKLYEDGFITYMRTDSVNVSEVARKAAEEFIRANYGDAYYPAKPNFFKSRETAQGAHEAIRPTDVGRTPDAAGLDPAGLKLYDLIWRRFMASQMADAKTVLKTAVFTPEKPALTHEYELTASATEVVFDGFLKVMKLSLKQKKAAEEDEGAEDTDQVEALPPMEIGEMLDVVRWIGDEKQTKGPSYYSEASLIKALEDNGVGRPSTYAQTIETLKKREYAETRKRKLVPTRDRGMVACDYLTSNLDSLFSVGYTAKMESELDKIEAGEESMDEMLSDFYKRLVAALGEVKAGAEPPPGKDKVELVLSLLAGVKTWKEPVKSGKRLYDDRKFVESLRGQYEAGKELSSRQFEYLVKMAYAYSGQIPDVDRILREAGAIKTSASAERAERADPSLVQAAFEVLERLGLRNASPFLESLLDQYHHNRPLSAKQFAILARTVLERSRNAPDAEEIAAKFSPFVPGGVSAQSANREIGAMLEMAREIKVWREKKGGGKRVYDDKAFIASLTEQFGRRGTLSDRQVAALKKVLYAYRAQIEDYAARAEKSGAGGGDKDGQAQ